jgi:Notch-like protein
VLLDCVRAFDSLCQPCRLDGDCSTSSVVAGPSLCLSQGDAGSFCGGDCSDVGCPTGYECVELDLAGSVVAPPQCVRINGAVCSCDSQWAGKGLTTDCATVNAFGACGGQRGCAPGGLTPCDAQVPSAEICDGVDNDCDGETDNILNGCGTVGACCIADGGCAQVAELSCLNSGGQFLGFGIGCSGVSCGGNAVGACCYHDDECGNLGVDICVQTGGSYQGDSTGCGVVDCSAAPLLGACCAFNGSCTNATAVDCAFSEGVFAGTGSDCTQAVCDQQGGCCLPSLQCVTTTGVSCDIQNGDFKPLIGCDTQECILPEGSGACCFDGGCDLSSGEDCVGQFLAGEPCVGQCPPSLNGACCDPTDGCVIGLESECPADDTFAGVGTDCSACKSPKGICCKGTNCYPGLTNIQCETVSGTWPGPDATCDACTL